MPSADNSGRAWETTACLTWRIALSHDSNTSQLDCISVDNKGNVYNNQGLRGKPSPEANGKHVIPLALLKVLS